MRPEQQNQVNRWIAEYRKVTGRQLGTADYDGLPISTRTTFDAVTHALLNTKLTGPNGAPMGTALDLIDIVEGVHGQIPEARGDHQFRLYVKLKPDAVERLYRCREFLRTGDNTIYHIGYPVNFRQQGGTPSIQFSITRAGRRADIDVDYRSSSGPKALVNGHLTSANSDVRAGDNQRRHAARWQGLEDWWRNVLGLFKPATVVQTTLSMGVTVPVEPRVKGSAPVEEAVNDYFQSWLVEGKPEEAMAYVSVQSNACLAEYHTGEDIDSGLAALRVLQHMRQALLAYGKSDTLETVIQGAPLYAPGARPVTHGRGKLFSLEQLPDDMAQTMDCRVRLKTTLAEELPRAGRGTGETYAAMTRLLKETGAPVVLVQLWGKEEGNWKIISWHYENPLRPATVPVVRPRETTPARRAEGGGAASGLAQTANQFLRVWLVERQYDEAAKYFSPSVSDCADVKYAGSPRAFLASVGGLLPRLPDLSGLIETVEHGHQHLEEVSHPRSREFLLARVSDDLAAMQECRVSEPGRDAVSGAARFGGNKFQTIFRLKNSSGTAGSVVLQWTQPKDRWLVTSAHIVAN